MNRTEWLESGFPDNILQPVAGHMVVLDSAEEAHPHSHQKVQLLFAISGVITVEVEAGLWTVPPGCAIWIPSGATHAARFVGQASIAMLYLAPEIAASLRAECGIIFVPPLLRELILRFSRSHTPFEDSGMVKAGVGGPSAREERLVAVLMDELAAAPEEPLHLPMPRDRRLRRIALAMLDDPAQRLTIDEWGARVGASNRTLSRLFREETGMSFGVWRHQLHVGLGMQKLASGSSVTNVALDLGYQNVGAFISMFKRMMGVSPARYFDLQQETVGETPSAEPMAPLAAAGAEVVEIGLERLRRR